MKITKTKLVEIIKEELDAVLAEEEGSDKEEEEWQKPENLSDKEQEQWEKVFNAVLDEIPEDVEDAVDDAAKAANKFIADLRSGNYSKPLPAGDDDDISF